jgi:hypothetical protein
MTPKISSIFKEDGRNIGIAACFIAAPKSYHKIWEPLDMTPEEALNEIITGEHDQRAATNNAIDELALSVNMAKYHFPHDGIHQDFIFHPYDSVDNDEKIRQIKKVVKKWKATALPLQ